MMLTWPEVERYVAMKAGQYARRLDGYGGATAEDLYQSGYLAFVEASKTYDPEGGRSFISWLTYYLQSAFAEAAGYRSKKRDPLDAAADLDADLPGAEDFTLADTVADPDAAQGFEDVERVVWLEQLRPTLAAALDTLSERDRAIIHAHYFQGRSLPEIAPAVGLSYVGTWDTERRALRKLRKNQALAKFVEQRTPYYYRVGVNRFNSTGTSAVEEIVFRREKLRELREREDHED